MNPTPAVSPGDRRQLLGSDQLSSDRLSSDQLGSDQLSADCSRCVGLCCVALAFAKSADFAFEKDAGEECVNLQEDFRCGIHPQLRERGFKGCTVFDCFGAGQRVTQNTFGGQSWRDDPDVRGSMFAVFPIMRQLHEMLWYLGDAASRPQARAMRGDIDAVYAETERLTEQSAEEILAIDIDARRHTVNGVLTRVSERVRAGALGAAKPSRRVRAGADLLGADLAGHDLRGADLRGTLLIGANLRDADLSEADVIGADLRDADVGGADLSTALYLTQFQVSAANGDTQTKLPPTIDRPAHWVRP
jgi:uncharacterized protein YjbI with pentapeptide repeats